MEWGGLAYDQESRGRWSRSAATWRSKGAEARSELRPRTPKKIAIAKETAYDERDRRAAQGTAWLVFRGRVDPPRLQDRRLADDADARERHRLPGRGGVSPSRPVGDVGTRHGEAVDAQRGRITDKDFALARKIEEVGAVAAGRGRRARPARRTSSCGAAIRADDRAAMPHRRRVRRAAARAVRHRQARRAGAATRARRDGAAVRVRRHRAADHGRRADDDAVDRALPRGAGGTDLVCIPGLCEGDPRARSRDAARRARRERTERSARDPEYFGRAAAARNYGAWDIEILAEINNAPRLTRDEIRAAAEYFRASGADIIDIGCTPGLPFPRSATWCASSWRRDARQRRHVRRRRNSHGGRRRRRAGAQRQRLEHRRGARARRHAARAWWSCRIWAARSTRSSRASRRSSAGAFPISIDPILEPIGFGFMASLERYAEVRRRYPEAEMLMGIGNLTELTAADSTGVNALLIAVCQELGIRAVLTTEVIPWARGAVREVDVARRLMHYAVTRHTIPKGVDDRLVTVKDPASSTLHRGGTASAAGRASPIRTSASSPIARHHGPEQRALRPRHRHPGHLRAARGRRTDARVLSGQGAGAREPRGHARQDLPSGGSLSWGYLTPPDDVKSEHVRLTQRPVRRSGDRSH